MDRTFPYFRMRQIVGDMVFNSPRNICCDYLLESPHWGNSNNISQHIFLGVNKGSVGILHSRKFFLTTKSQGTKTVIITKVLCTFGFLCNFLKSVISNLQKLGNQQQGSQRVEHSLWLSTMYELYWCPMCILSCIIWECWQCFW